MVAWVLSRSAQSRRCFTKIAISGSVMRVTVARPRPQVRQRMMYRGWLLFSETEPPSQG